MKKIGFVLSVCFIATQIAFVDTASAHFGVQEAHAKVLVKKENDMKVFPPRRPRMSKEQIIEKISKDYGYSKEILSPLANKYNPMDLRTSCFYAKVSGNKLEKVLELRQKNSWTKIRKILFKDAQDYADKMQAYEIKKFKDSDNLTREEFASILKKGYSANDIMQASVVAAKSKKSVAEVLPMRTAAFDWDAVEKKLGVWEESREQNPRKRVSVSIRRGPGFAGLHMGEKNQDELVDILHDDYLFSKEELEKYIGRLGFNELENICLVAYMAQVPLSKVNNMRSKYSWEIIKKKLGLTPKVYDERCIAYQARRLQERLEMPTELTISLMNEGISMHHSTLAFLLSKATNNTIENILNAKTPIKSWNDVAEEIGISKETLKEAQSKISATFGRH